jgi:hypothetical protein
MIQDDNVAYQSFDRTGYQRGQGVSQLRFLIPAFHDHCQHGWTQSPAIVEGRIEALKPSESRSVLFCKTLMEIISIRGFASETERSSLMPQSKPLMSYPT